MSESVPGRKCLSCAALRPRWVRVCPHCGAVGSDEVDFAGIGMVYSATTIRVPPLALQHLAPYDIVLVQLESGPRVLGRLQANATAHIGDRVELAERLGAALIFKKAS